MTGLATAVSALYSVTDAHSGSAHLVKEDALIAGRRSGCFRAVCGARVLAASLTVEERGHCKKCVQRVQRVQR